MMKRQGGYYPTTHLCGKGDTCAEACGPTQVQCPSESGLYCYDPTIGDHCCPDGTGNSCSKGYYCTTDGRSNTYCCPDGMDTADCAASYSLTVSLIKETGSVAVPTGSGSAAPVTTTPIHVSYPTVGPSVPVVPGGNATYTTSAPAQFTGAASKKGVVEGLVLGLAGLVAAL
ncbi:hypothetical protein K469DRAFT_635392 [Zopfia rhizophila CBS 207.26]|uniref:Uncharacterized protein n=1 Tax=Zopfia rhizophila CBS 207.26 TaxID=1314779 RepID=A0A6A6DYY4_9PEZI|nr:hypothetical protein K469DRAFT_635392 [Zopfia rhizophila CBS 207.26]